jgi:signal transduction histidine kinase
MFTAQDQPPFEPTLAIFVALVALASRTDGRPLWTAAAVSTGIFAAVGIRSELAGQGTGDVFHALLLFLLTFVIGRIVHEYRQRASGQQDRADQLERDQETRAARAVETERARIARELHDVIAHSLSVIVVQAAAERRVLPAGQQSTAETLESIGQSGRRARGRRAGPRRRPVPACRSRAPAWAAAAGPGSVLAGAGTGGAGAWPG